MTSAPSNDVTAAPPIVTSREAGPASARSAAAAAAVYFDAFDAIIFPVNGRRFVLGPGRAPLGSAVAEIDAISATGRRLRISWPWPTPAHHLATRADRKLGKNPVMAPKNKQRSAARRDHCARRAPCRVSRWNLFRYSSILALFFLLLLLLLRSAVSPFGNGAAASASARAFRFCFFCESFRFFGGGASSFVLITTAASETKPGKNSVKPPGPRRDRVSDLDDVIDAKNPVKLGNTVGRLVSSTPTGFYRVLPSFIDEIGEKTR